MIIVILLIPTLYYFFGMKKSVYWISHCIVWVAVLNKVIIEFILFLKIAQISQINFVEIFVVLPIYLIRQVIYIVTDSDIGVKVFRFFTDSWSSSVIDDIPDYYWYVRSVVLSVILLLNISLGYINVRTKRKKVIREKRDIITNELKETEQ